MTTKNDGGTGCSNPVEAATLMDYWLALLPSTAEDAIEEHLMTCDACGDRLRHVISLSEGLRTLAIGILDGGDQRSVREACGGDGSPRARVRACSRRVSRVGRG